MTTSSEKSICYLVKSFPSYSETFILNEIDELESFGISIFFISLSRNADPVHELAKKWVNHVHWPPFLFSANLWFAHVYFALTQPKKYIYALRNYHQYGGKRDFLKAIYFARVVQKEGIRHIHAQFGWSAGAAMLIAFLTGADFSFILHHADIFYVPPPNMAELINRSRFCVTISQFNKRYLLNHWPAINQEKIKVIRCGVDPEKFVPATRIHSNDKEVELLAVARLAELKNISFLVEICSSLQKQGYRYTCTIVGDGPERLKLERQIRKLDLEDRVFLKGMISQEELVNFYQNADIFVMTSKSEGIPVVAMEAMASRLPIIAPSIKGIPELVVDDKTGFLFPENALEKATDAVVKVIKDPALRVKMGICGRDKVISEYNIRINSQQLAKNFFAMMKI